VEGIVDDLKRGHIPNIFAEKGMKAELKHNPKGFAKRMLVTVAVASIAYAILSKKSKRR
jgi:hypothetical protein